MTCACGNKNAYRISYSASGEKCDSCGDIVKTTCADVIFKAKQGAYLDANITDPVKAPHGTMITSRSHKAEVMKANGLKEVGDKRHGSRDRF